MGARNSNTRELPAPLEIISTESGFTPNTSVYNLKSTGTGRTQLTVAGTLNSAGNLPYFIDGCTVGRLEVAASASVTVDHVFTVVRVSGMFGTVITPTSAACTMTNGTSSCVYSGPNVTIPAGNLIGVQQSYSTTNNPVGWIVRIALRCE